jgi:hypothetical protein
MRLDELVKPVHLLHRGDYLFRNGEHFRALYIVKTGSVKQFVPSTEGSEQVVGFHLPGDLIGLEGVDQQRYDGAAVVLETAAICEIPFAALAELATQSAAGNVAASKQLLKEIERGSMIGGGVPINKGPKAKAKGKAQFLKCADTWHKEYNRVYHSVYAIAVQEGETSQRDKFRARFVAKEPFEFK